MPSSSEHLPAKGSNSSDNVPNNNNNNGANDKNSNKHNYDGDNVDNDQNDDDDDNNGSEHPLPEMKTSGPIQHTTEVPPQVRKDKDKDSIPPVNLVEKEKQLAH
jgi:hypothetical protein